MPFKQEKIIKELIWEFNQTIGVHLRFKAILCTQDFPNKVYAITIAMITPNYKLNTN